MNSLTKLSAIDTSIMFFDAYNKHEIDEMIKLFADNGEIVFQPLGGDGKGKVSELGQAIWSQLIHSFPNISCEILKSKVDDEGNVICEVNFKGRQEDDFAGLANKGKSFDTDHVFVFKLNEQNLIDSLTVTWDHDDFCRQLS